MSDESPPESPALLSKHRIEALSDGVFAVAMTLLVLDIKPAMEPNAGDLAVEHMILGLGLPVLTFAFTFLLTCIFWILHHREFALLRHTNSVHITLSLIVLFTVTLLPVSVSIYLHASTNYLAQTLYIGNFTLIALPLLVSWLYARRAGLVDASRPALLVQRLTRRLLAMTLMGVIATLAFWLGKLWLIFFSVPVVIYLRYREGRAAAAFRSSST